MGKLITLEGGEGAGKTTALNTLERCLEDQGVRVARTREPGGTPLAESVRELLLAPRDEVVDATCELLLFFASRAQHLYTHILPALARGDWVLCDRFTDSTVAYQGYGRDLGVAKIEQLEQFTQGDVRPDMTFVLDVDPEIGLMRARGRGVALDRMESEAMGFHRRVRQGFLERAQAHPERYCIIDASQSLKTVTESLKSAVVTLTHREGILIMTNTLDVNDIGKMNTMLADLGLTLTHGPYIGEEIPTEETEEAMAKVDLTVMAQGILTLNNLVEADADCFSVGIVTLPEEGTKQVSSPPLLMGLNDYCLINQAGVKTWALGSETSHLNISDKVYRVQPQRYPMAAATGKGTLNQQVLDTIADRTIRKVFLESVTTATYKPSGHEGQGYLMLSKEHYDLSNDKSTLSLPTPNPDWDGEAVRDMPLWACASSLYSHDIENQNLEDDFIPEFLEESIQAITSRGYGIYPLREHDVAEFEKIDMFGPLRDGVGINKIIKGLYWLMVDSTSLEDSDRPAGENCPVGISFGHSAYYLLDYCCETGDVKMAFTTYDGIMELTENLRIYVGRQAPVAHGADSLQARIDHCTKMVTP